MPLNLRFIDQFSSRTPRRAAARLALQARPIPHHGEVLAFGAGGAFVAFRLRRQTLVRHHVARGGGGRGRDFRGDLRSHLRRGFRLQRHGTLCKRTLRQRPRGGAAAQRGDVGAPLGAGGRAFRLHRLAGATRCAARRRAADRGEDAPAH